VRKGGIILKNAPNEKANPIFVVPAKARLTVGQVVITDSANEIWLEVQFNNDKGFIYAGHSYPTLTVGDWVKVIY
jgi:hypothetical protein